MKLKFTKFLMPDEAAGGGGGGAATIDPPAGGDVLDPLTYEPPASGALEDFLSAGDGTASPTGTTKTLPVKTDDAAVKAAADKVAADKAASDKAAADKATADAAAAKTKEPPANQLRAQLTKLETTNADLQKQLEAAKSDTRISELTKKIEANEAAQKAVEAQKVDLEKKLLVHNPHVAKPLLDLRAKFNDDYNRAMEDVPKLKPVYRATLDEFEALPRGTDEYADALAEFRAGIKEAWGDDAPAVYEALRRGLQFRTDYAKLATETQENAFKYKFDAERSEWTANHTALETEFPTYFQPPADAEANDPYHPVRFLNAFEEGMPPDQVAKINGNLKTMLDRAFNGAQPKSKSDFVGMTDEQISVELDRQAKGVEESRGHAKRIAAVGGKALCYMRPVIAELMKLREKVAAFEKSTPPDPSKTPGTDAPGATGDSLLDYRPPPLTEADIS